MEFFINHIFDLLTLLVALAGVIVAIREYFRANSLQKSKSLYDVLSEFKKDKEIFEMFYKIEYENFYYDISFHESRKEKSLDRLLLLLNYTCYLRERGIVSDSEFNQFRYIADRCLSSDGVKNYLYNIYHFSFKSLNNNDEQKKDIDHIDVCPFSALIRYGEKNKVIKSTFYDLTRESVPGSPYKYILG